MPEGHTIRRLALDLNEAFAGNLVSVSSPQGRFAAEAAQLHGQELIGASAFGKHLFVEFPDDLFVHIHLGLIGTFVLYGAPAPAPVGAVRLRLADATTYADLRGAITCDLIGARRRAEIVETLGADPLDPLADPGRAWVRVSKSARSIGDLLMDQTVFAGVGNVYRAEVLFRQRLHPLRPGKSLRRAQFDAVWNDLVELMAAGVLFNRIDTVRPEHTPEAMSRAPRQDDHGGEVYVYRRTGQPCHVCHKTVRTEALAGRNSFWCPGCQRAYRGKA